MKAMIFAAGLGTRLKPFTESHPKALLPLAGKPLLQWQLDMLWGAGIREIVVNVHHHAEQVESYLRTHERDEGRVVISDERNGLLDTGGGLRKAMRAYGDGDETPWLVCNVDILSNIRVEALLSAHRAEDIGTVVVSRRQTQRYLLFDEAQRLRGWTHMGTGEVRPAGARAALESCSRLAFSGMQVVSPRMLGYMDEVAEERGEKFSLIDLYLHVCARHPEEVIRGYVPEGYRMMDVGKIEQLREAEAFAEDLR